MNNFEKKVLTKRAECVIMVIEKRKGVNENENGYQRFAE
jgi:hypothetical protein